MITVKRRRSVQARHGFLLLVCLSWVKGATLVEAAESSKGTESALAMSEVRSGVYVHEGVHEDINSKNRGNIANIGFIVGSESVAIIDPGAGPDVSRRLLLAVHRQTTRPISHVILTHLHPDHVLGAGVFPDSVTVVAHENYTRALVQRGRFYIDRYEEVLGIDRQSLRPPDTTVPVGETLTIDLGNRPLKVHAYPVAHTDNDVSVYDANAEVLWASDLLFETRIPSLDGSLVGWLAAMEHIERQYAGTFAIPGHGRPGPLEPILARQRQYLQTLASEVRQGIADNQRLSEAVERIGASMQSEWALFELHHRGNVSKAWSELEWE